LRSGALLHKKERCKQKLNPKPKMQSAIALTFLSTVSEEQFSLDELVVCLREVMEKEGLPALLRLILELLDELWALRAMREGKGLGSACCAKSRLELKDRAARQLRTSAGVINFHWRRLRCARCGRQCVPLRQWLGLERWQRKTGELERMVVEVVSEQSYRRSSRHLDLIGQIPVPKSTAHRWVVQTGSDELPGPEQKLPTLMVDGTGYKRRPIAENEFNNKGELRVVIGLDEKGQAVPIGSWSGQSWQDIATELEGKSPGPKLAEQLSCDGEPGLAEALARLVNSVQRCQWHMVHDLDRLMWFDKAPLLERRHQQKKLAALIGLELPTTDFQKVQPADKEKLQQQARGAERELEKLAGALLEKGYSQAAVYINSARQRLFSYVDFWLATGLAAPRTTSFLERLMRELGRRLKRIAFGWSEKGAAKMARILIKRICDPAQWAAYWKDKLRLHGNVVILFRGAKVVPA
jgi:hypothetical protein